jgi:glycosyltransferase involved in cell wall biosynthesis
MFISICIPAYKRVEFLRRLLDSITIQTFRDFEVVVTDDSPANEVHELCKEFDKIPIRYYKNEKPLGTPENWNASIRLARGEWIKLMHDDDWFDDEDSLQHFVDAVREHPSQHFFFSAYRNVFEPSGKIKEVFASIFERNRIKKDPVVLFAKNVIGPPSVVLHKNSGEFWYDPRIKWVVDIDFYIRYLKKYEAIYIPNVMVNVGMHAGQVTSSSFRVTDVEIPENFYLLNKVGAAALKNLRIYDGWWRLMRNLNITEPSAVAKAGYTGNLPPAIISMINWQKKIPRRLLVNGVVSKMTMLANYFFNQRRLR